METKIQEGSVGSADLKQEAGVASVTETIGPAKIGKYLNLQGSLAISLDEKALIEDLIAKYGPTGVLGEILKAGEDALLAAAPAAAPAAPSA